MIIRETELPGAYLIDLEPARDERGLFARTFCADEFAAQGLETRWVQSNLSYNARRGTLRGMHWQVEPHAETKLVRCSRGAIHDVIVDLRPDSQACGRWLGVELTAENRRSLYVPRGFAHGFLTLVDATEVTYEMGTRYAPSAARGFRWDDPRISIDWPGEPTVLSPRDAAYEPLPEDLAKLSGAEGAS